MWPAFFRTTGSSCAREDVTGGRGDTESLGLFTIGHSVLGPDDFVSRLQAAQIRGLADVRRLPASRRHPHFNRSSLEQLLDANDIGYRWFEALGGRRHASAAGEQSPNLGLRAGGFRAYADYALTPPFQAALEDLLGWARGQCVAVCCAEALWWRCHRRIIADHLAARGHAVLHILSDGKVAAHELWELARLTPAGPTYPPPQSELFQPSP